MAGEQVRKEQGTLQSESEPLLLASIPHPLSLLTVSGDGRWIAGAVLSSLPAAAAYAGELAAASGWQNFLLTVVSR